MAYGQMYQGYGNSMYGSGNGYGQMYPQQSYQGYQAPPQQNFGQQGQGIDWVDGEAAARAMQIPAGVSQHAMWDINEPVIYLKSINGMGMPNPLRKLRYEMEDAPQGNRQSQAMLTGGNASGAEEQGMSQYVRRDEAEGFVKKDDLERMKTELMESIQGISAANGQTRRNAKGE